jgi:rhomboid protease GluP
MCPHCRAFITIKDRICPYCNEAVGPPAARRADPSALLGGFIPHARFNTILILMINFGLYVITAVYSMKAGGGALEIDPQTLVDFGAKWSPAIAAGQWWRLVTAGFLHGGLLHILMNSWVLFDLGAQVEEIYGAMIALGVRHRNPMGAAIRGMYIRWAIYGMLFSLLPGIDMAAHIGGIAGGFGLAYLAGTPEREGSVKERIWRAASWLCVLIAVVSFLEMYVSFSRAM